MDCVCIVWVHLLCSDLLTCVLSDCCSSYSSMFPAERKWVYCKSRTSTIRPIRAQHWNLINTWIMGVFGDHTIVRNMNRVISYPVNNSRVCVCASAGMLGGSHTGVCVCVWFHAEKYAEWFYDLIKKVLLGGQVETGKTQTVICECVFSVGCGAERKSVCVWNHGTIAHLLSACKFRQLHSCVYLSAHTHTYTQVFSTSKSSLFLTRG